MTTFVLVHGASHGSWCWKRVRGALRALGHEVFTPTLTGLGERSHLLSREVNLTTHILDVVNLIQWEALTEVVLVGHSYGGLVVRGAADQAGEAVAALVYLDAFVVEDGQSLEDTMPPEQVAAMHEMGKAMGDPVGAPPMPAAMFNLNEADQAWVDAQCTPHPIATFQEKLRLTRDPAAEPPSHYIYASAWSFTPFTPFYEGAKARGWPTREIACGHDVMLDAPEELTAALAEIGG